MVPVLPLFRNLSACFSSVVFVGLLALAPASGSTLTLVTDNSQLIDVASWGALGSPSTTQPVSGTVTSANGIVVTPVGPTGGALYRLDNVSGGFGGGFGFPNGDQLLYNGGSLTGKKGAITINFSSAMFGAGLLFVDTNTGVNDTVSLSAFDANNILLTTVTVPFNGFVSTAPVFIGVTDTVAEISSIRVGSGANDFAVDTLYLSNGSGGTNSTAPEPMSALLAGGGILLFGAVRRLKN